MCHRNNVKKVLPIFPILLIVLFYQPMQAHASANLSLDGAHHDRHGRYTEVVVGSDRYYYDGGVFYRQNAGNYVVVEAPVGAVVYSVPSGYERVEMNGESYYRYGNVYYRPAGRGYEVVRPERSRDQGDNHGRGGDKRDEHHGN
jgi:hypothetical protein